MLVLLLLAFALLLLASLQEDSEVVELEVVLFPDPLEVVPFPDPLEGVELEVVELEVVLLALPNSSVKR
jgi:hypothetical protein